MSNAKKSFVVEFLLPGGEIWEYSLDTPEDSRNQINTPPHSATHYRTHIKTQEGNLEKLFSFSEWLPITA